MINHPKGVPKKNPLPSGKNVVRLHHSVEPKPTEPRCQPRPVVIWKILGLEIAPQLVGK